ncbi:hypothetical protein PFISCL1PPCAC_412, partial [Pristionchus fissidentatus]
LIHFFLLLSAIRGAEPDCSSCDSLTRPSDCDGCVQPTYDNAQGSTTTASCPLDKWTLDGTTEWSGATVICKESRRNEGKCAWFFTYADGDDEEIDKAQCLHRKPCDPSTLSVGNSEEKRCTGLYYRSAYGDSFISKSKERVQQLKESKKRVLMGFGISGGLLLVFTLVTIGIGISRCIKNNKKTEKEQRKLSAEKAKGATTQKKEDVPATTDAPGS